MINKISTSISWNSTRSRCLTTTRSLWISRGRCTLFYYSYCV